MLRCMCTGARRGYPLLLLLWWCATAWAASPAVTVRATENLQGVARASAAHHVPILLEFAASDCHYCAALEERVLNPMLVSGEYTHKVLIRKVEIDSGDVITDFHGRRVPVAEFARRRGVRVTPVVMFLGPDGRELAPRLVGLSSVDFYGDKLDAGINTALAHLRQRLATGGGALTLAHR